MEGFIPVHSSDRSASSMVVSLSRWKSNIANPTALRDRYS
jgi:hypothetical protein